MNIVIFARHIKQEDISYLQQLMHSFQGKGINSWVYAPLWDQVKDQLDSSILHPSIFSKKEQIPPIDFLLSLGGDGTLLHALSIIQQTQIPVLGINLGNLGFLTSIGKEGIEGLAEDLLQKRYNLEERTLLSFQSSENCTEENLFAMNEISIHRKEDFSLLGIDLFVDNEFVAHYYGDGLIVATPTGSTAYSLSCGGPILAPTSTCFVVTPIAAHMLTLRPIIISDQSIVRLEVRQLQKDYYVSIDSRQINLDKPCTITLMKADFSVKLVRMEGDSFYTSIRNKLMWGEIYKR